MITFETQEDFEAAVKRFIINNLLVEAGIEHSRYFDNPKVSISLRMVGDYAFCDADTES